MLSAQEMNAKADQCDDMARKAHDRLLAHTSGSSPINGGTWPTNSISLSTARKLEHSPVYRMIRDRQNFEG
jgi:hypothetical protein